MNHCAALLLVLLVLCIFTCCTVQAETSPEIASTPVEFVDSPVEEAVTEGEREGRKGRRKGKGRGKGKGKGRREPPERISVRAWAEGLSDEDYSEEHWRDVFHSNSASDFFNNYAKKISALFKENSAKVNFALIGACDGLGDSTIKKLYLPNSHWRGVFVEPMSINVRDLIKFMADHDAGQRSVIIRAAATSKCVNETILVERPLYEEKNASLPVSIIYS